MKIRSKFKDYYDFIGQRYGEDPEVVYSRGNLKKDFTFFNGFMFYLESRDSPDDRTTYEIEVLIAGGFAFPLVRMNPRDSDQPTAATYRNLDCEMFNWIRNPWYATSGAPWKAFLEELEKFRVEMQAVQAKLNAPVFLIYRVPHGTGYQGRVYPKVPILKDYGIPALVEPQEMWQSIYGTFTNVLRKNPDKEVPVQLADKDKIVKAGFDLKTSFRNPINKKAKHSKW